MASMPRNYLRMTCTDMGLIHLLPSRSIYRALCGVDGLRWTRKPRRETPVWPLHRGAGGPAIPKHPAREAREPVITRKQVDDFIRDVLDQDPTEVMSIEIVNRRITVHVLCHNLDGTIQLDHLGPTTRAVYLSVYE